MAAWHPLDNPARAALLGPQVHLAERCGAVLRYPADISSFIALPDDPGLRRLGRPRQAGRPWRRRGDRRSACRPAARLAGR